MSTTAPTTVPSTRNAALTAARVAAAVIGGLQFAGFFYFMLIEPDEEAVRLGPWIDYPITTVLLIGVALKLATAFAPSLGAARRIRIGFLAVGLGIVVTLLKVPLYGEPEGATFLILEALLLWLLWRARRPEITGH